MLTKYINKTFHWLKAGRSFLQECMLFLLILTVFPMSCKKLVDAGTPKNELTRKVVFENDYTATAAVSMLYTSMSSGSGSLSSITYLGGILSDEAIAYSLDINIQQFYKNNILPTNTLVSGFWGAGYNYIYNTNAIIEGLESSNSITPELKKELLGEVKFIRAFQHMYLVTLYGDIPYITTSDYRLNAKVSRLPVNIVYDSIINDLKDARDKLSSTFDYAAGERVKPTKWAATALLARAYLYSNHWLEAEQEATTVINSSDLFGLTSLDSVFLKNSREAIWQLRPLSTGRNTNEGNIFILTGKPNNSSLRTEFINAFEGGDNRKSKWVGSIVSGGNTYYFPYKYKIRIGGSPLNEYSMVIRLAELYLIRAEARAQQNNVIGSQSDLNSIRNRAGLSNTAADDKASLFLAIENERRFELFSEWGHRWFDLERTKRMDIILGAVKVGWVSTDGLLPIPQKEILANTNMTQNPGY